MQLKHLLTVISLSLLISLPAASWAQAGKDKAKSARQNQDRAAQMRSRADEAVDEATVEQRQEMSDEARGRGRAGRDRPVREDDVVVEHGGDMEEHRDDMADAPGADIKGERGANAKAAEMRGNETAQEMRARRDERKAIMAEEKSKNRSGDEVTAGLDSDDVYDELKDDAEKKPKKSWWKFWED